MFTNFMLIVVTHIVSLEISREEIYKHHFSQVFLVYDFFIYHPCTFTYAEQGRNKNITYSEPQLRKQGPTNKTWTLSKDYIYLLFHFLPRNNN